VRCRVPVVLHHSQFLHHHHINDLMELKRDTNDEMQELIDELQRHQVSLQYATREVHLKLASDRQGAEPLAVQMSYLIAFDLSKTPTEFAVLRKLDFPL
jgi:hypothetical protein